MKQAVDTEINHVFDQVHRRGRYLVRGIAFDQVSVQVEHRVINQEYSQVCQLVKERVNTAMYQRPIG